MTLHPLIQALPFGLVILGYIAGLFVDILEVDAAQYATMAMEMADSGDFLHLYDKGLDYLDKPPMVFWMAGVFFKLFGVSTLTYKLPSVLFSLIAVYATGKLATFLYERRTGYMAALILASCQAFFLMNNDVKTDMYLTSMVIVAVWQLTLYSRGGKWWNLQLGFAAMGLAMLSKGPIGVVAPALALGADFVIRRDWKGLFRWQWLMGIPTFLVLQLPFCAGLYDQHGWEGVRFYFWTQSFGRITGESEWTNDATVFFFVHNFAWSFLPWTLAALVAMGKKLYRIVRDGFFLPGNAEAISVMGFVLVFCALSVSRFKLPHYIYVTYPFAAIMTAELLGEWLDQVVWNKWARALSWVHLGLFVLGLLLVFVLSFWAFPGMFFLWILLGIGGGAGLVYLYFQRKHALLRLVIVPAAGFALCNFLINVHVYPAMAPYQSTATAGKYLRRENVPQDRLFVYAKSGRALDFYNRKRMVALQSLGEIKRRSEETPTYLYTDEPSVEHLTKRNFDFDTLKVFDNYRISRLSLPFINPATRPATLSRRFILYVKGKQ